MDSHANSQMTELKLETKSTELEYKVEDNDTSNEYQMRIDAVTGDVIKGDTKNLDHEDKMMV